MFYILFPGYFNTRKTASYSFIGLKNKPLLMSTKEKIRGARYWRYDPPFNKAKSFVLRQRARQQRLRVSFFSILNPRPVFFKSTATLSSTVRRSR